MSGLVALSNSCAQDDPDRKTAQQDLIRIQEALKKFYSDTGWYPMDSEQLSVLIDDQRIKEWKGPYISSDGLIDPWHHSYNFGTFRDVIFIASAGRNGEPETTHLDLNQGLSRGDDIIIMFPNQEP